MSAKILVADDSLTIQKVISITLSSTGHELLTANSYQDLIEKLKNEEINLVLLDFNLSENIDGYSLAKKIKEMSPVSEVIMMYGTFDNVDEGQLSDSDVTDKVIKPFESSMFIQKCNDALGESNISGVEISEEQTEEVGELTQESANLSSMENIFSSDDNWVMSAPSMDEDNTESSEVADPASETDRNLILMESAVEGKNQDILKNEIEDWGMSIPAKIDGEEERVSMPPAIAGEQDIDEESGSHHEIVDIEEHNDEAMEKTNEHEVITLDNSFVEDEKPALQSIDEFSLNDEMTEMTIDEESSDEEEPDTVEELAKDVEDEISADNFWAADEDGESSLNVMDENISLDSENQLDPDATLEIIPDELTGGSQETFEAPSENLNLNEEQIVAALFEKIQPMLDAKIEDYIKQHLDNSAWEIIPDLAENVIKEEVRRISDSVLDNHSSAEK